MITIRRSDSKVSDNAESELPWQRMMQVPQLQDQRLIHVQQLGDQQVSQWINQAPQIVAQWPGGPF